MQGACLLFKRWYSIRRVNEPLGTQCHVMAGTPPALYGCVQRTNCDVD